MKSSCCRTACACSSSRPPMRCSRVDVARAPPYAASMYVSARRHRHVDAGRQCIDDEVSVEIAQFASSGASPFDARAVVDRAPGCPRLRSATSAARAVPPAPMTAALRVARGSSAREAVDVRVVGEDASVHVHERVHGPRALARSRRSPRRVARERERVFLERRGDAEAARLAAQERIRDLVEALDRRDRVCGGHAFLAEEPVVDRRREAVPRGIADDGEHFVRALRRAAVDLERALERELSRRGDVSNTMNEARQQ